uniref:Uncharacterized protein n=1 Tax=Anguilla anguilla TaxID=7936 RepID=A0A0E9V1L4_ANGAN
MSHANLLPGVPVPLICPTFTAALKKNLSP